MRRYYTQVQNKRGETFIFFVIFGDPPHLILTPPPLINFLNFTRDYKEVHKYIMLFMFRYCKRLRNILEIPMLGEVNKFNSIILFSSFFFHILFPSHLLFRPPPEPENRYLTWNRMILVVCTESRCYTRVLVICLFFKFGGKITNNIYQ